jgi:disulfide oxidoreductase YuzD
MNRWNRISNEIDWLEILEKQKFADLMFDYQYLKESSVLHLLADNGKEQVYEFKKKCVEKDYFKKFREWVLKEKR